MVSTDTVAWPFLAMIRRDRSKHACGGHFLAFDDLRHFMDLVFTIGYEGTDIERFVASLKAVGIRVLADVRAVAVSRKKGFSKNILKSRLEQEGITYLHFQALGDPKPGRDAAREGRFDEFRDIYSRHLEACESQDSLIEIMNTSRKTATCLLCFEREPTNCHRSLIADSMRRKEFAVKDLFVDLPRRDHGHPDKSGRNDIGQSVAAAE